MPHICKICVNKMKITNLICKDVSMSILSQQLKLCDRTKKLHFGLTFQIIPEFISTFRFHNFPSIYYFNKQYID